MKLQDTTNTIEKIGNVTSESQFRMKTSRKAFQILSDLYSDKPLAIVRELGCNAADSMIAAGKGDKPFHIHIPNTLEPWLIIQDFGTGIQHEDIYNIYSVYFESTKTNTNTQVGCLGLGSKSPFCYADNFVITSIYDGVKRIYNAYFNESNTPAIALMSMENSTDETGVAIQIPVKRENFNEFVDAIKRAFRFFDVKPTITGGTIDWKNETPIFEGDGWSSYASFGYNEAFAIMGGVTYPIDAYLMTSHTKHSDFLRRGGLVLKFEIGELDFVPSREALSYCPQTIEAIKNKLEFVVKDFESKLEKTIEDKPNVIDAIRSLVSLRSKFDHLQSLSFDKITWRNIQIGNPIALIHKISNNSQITTHTHTKYGKRKFRESNQISFSTNAKWYYDDLDKGTTARIKAYLRDNQDDAICVFSQNAYNALTTNSNPDLCFEKGMFLPTSSLPKAYRAAYVRSNNGSYSIKKGIKIYTIGDYWKQSWEARELDVNDPPKYYMVKNSGFEFSLKPKNMYSFTEKSELRNLLEFMGIDNVVMIAQSNVKHLKGIAKNFVEHLNSFQFKYDSNDIATARKYNDAISDLEDNERYQKFSQMHPEHPFVKLVRNVSKSKKAVEHLDKISNRIIVGENVKGYELESDNAALRLLADKMGDYHWEAESVLTILENLEK